MPMVMLELLISFIKKINKKVLMAKLAVIKV
jgi:hypothetical protein